jgi:hypothetical protein
MKSGIINQREKPKRNLFLRIIFGILWFIPICFVTNIIIGGIVGVIAGTSTQSYDAAYEAGQLASIIFFQKYWLIVLFFQILFTTVLSCFGILPGTGKFKMKKNT